MNSMQTKHIGVLMGGQSAERDISLKSGQAVADSLMRQGYRVTCIDVTPNLGEELRRKHIELAFVALHGPGGEDGAIQGFLEVMDIPYTGSGIAASAVGMNKVLTKAILKSAGLPIPPSIVLTVSALSSVIRKETSLPFPFPVVAKPVAQGSSLGVSVMYGVDDMEDAHATAMQFGQQVMIEQFIAGAEFTVGIIGETPLPVLEIILANTLFDFDTKYEVSAKPHAVRVALSPDRTSEIQQLALRVHQEIGCRGFSRVDIRLDDAGDPFVLEINTIPGMTNESLLPLAAHEADITYDCLVETILHATAGK
ncbi:MAG TPA: D-alanine--D-alanine ligase [Nitrospirales bacterium]|nr:D-alanine--D-alanine ligase [Nitrospirales bacterium]